MATARVARNPATHRGVDRMARITFGDVADVAVGEAEGLPPTDQVHDFLDLLDALAAMEE